MGAALAGLLVSIGGPMLTAVLSIFAAGALRRVAAWVVLGTILAGLFAAVNALLVGIRMVIPDWLAIASTWILPSNFSACVTVYLSATALITLYKWKKRGIQLALGL